MVEEASVIIIGIALVMAALGLIFAFAFLNFLYVRSFCVTMFIAFISNPFLFILLLPLPFLAIPLCLGFALRPLHEWFADASEEIERRRCAENKEIEERQRQNELDWQLNCSGKSVSKGLKDG